MMDNHETAKHVIDGAAASITVATFFGWLPTVAAVLTIIWTAIRIWESDTVQKFIGRWKSE